MLSRCDDNQYCFVLPPKVPSYRANEPNYDYEEGVKPNCGETSKREHDERACQIACRFCHLNGRTSAALAAPSRT